MRLFKEHTRNKNREALRLRTATEEEVITFMSNLTTLRRMSCGPSLQPPGEEYYGTDARSPQKHFHRLTHFLEMNLHVSPPCSATAACSADWQP